MSYALWDTVIQVVCIVGDTVIHVVCIVGIELFMCSVSKFTGEYMETKTGTV